MKSQPVASALSAGSLPGVAQDSSPKWDVEIPAPVVPGALPMKKALVSLAFWSIPFLTYGDTGTEVRTSPATTVASIPGPVADGAPSSPPPPVEKPDFQIEGTQVKQVEVVEPPPMAGLPPVEGTMTLKVHSVADPGLPDPPAPLPANHPQIREQLGELSATHRGTRIAFVSATVYDRSRTLLTCYPNGGNDKTITVWSNLDFNHFCGFGSFEATSGEGEVRRYALLMGIGNENTESRRRLSEARGIEYDESEIPEFPHATPSFVVVTENPDPESVTLIEDLHALYRAEGTRMAAACAAREQAHEERRAFLLANPPKPKDVTIHFWKRENPEAPASPQEGDQP